MRRVKKLGANDSEYDLELLDGRTVPLGCAADLLSPAKVQAAFVDALGHLIPDVKRTDWRRVAKALIRLVEEVNADDTQDAETRDLLAAFTAGTAGAGRGKTGGVDLDEPEELADVLAEVSHGAQRDSGRVVLEPSPRAVHPAPVANEVRLSGRGQPLDRGRREEATYPPRIPRLPARRPAKAGSPQGKAVEVPGRLRTRRPRCSP